MEGHDMDGGEGMVVGVGYAYAGAGRRCAATAIDLAALVVVTALAWLGGGGNSGFAVVCALTFVLLQWGWESTRGCTVGKVATRLRTVRDDPHADDPRAGLLPPGLSRGAVRGIVEAVGALFAAVGALLLELTCTMDRDRRRAWQDRVSGTAVVDVSARYVGWDDDLEDGADGDDRAVGEDDGVGAIRSMDDDRGSDFDDDIVVGSSSGVGLGSRSMTAATAAVPTGASVSSATASAGAVPIPGLAPALSAAPMPLAPGSAPTSIPAPAPAPASAAMPATPSIPSAPAVGPRAALYFENGSSIDLAIPGKAVLGRNPSSDDPGVMRVRVPDTTDTISRTHAMLEIAGGRMWVTDLNSTNGTEVIAEGSAVRLARGQRREVPFGARIMLGSTALSVTLVRGRSRGRGANGKEAGR